MTFWRRVRCRLGPLPRRSMSRRTKNALKNWRKSTCKICLCLRFRLILSSSAEFTLYAVFSREWPLVLLDLQHLKVYFSISSPCLLPLRWLQLSCLWAPKTTKATPNFSEMHSRLLTRMPLVIVWLICYFGLCSTTLYMLFEKIIKKSEIKIGLYLLFWWLKGIWINFCYLL